MQVVRPDGTGAIATEREVGHTVTPIPPFGRIWSHPPAMDAAIQMVGVNQRAPDQIAKGAKMPNGRLRRPRTNARVGSDLSSRAGA